MEARAVGRFIRVSPRKVKPVLDLIRGKSLPRAYAILDFTPKRAAKIVEKVVKSAAANLGKGIKLDDFYIREAWVGVGPMMKRLNPMAMGRGAIIRHRTAHIRIRVGDQRS